MYKDRFKKVWRKLQKEKLSGLIVTNPINIYYLTGFRGVSDVEREAIALVSKNGVTILLPKMYEETYRAIKIPGIKVEILEERHYLFTVIGKSYKAGSRVGVEAENLRLSEYGQMKKSTKIKLVETVDIVEGIRVTKDKKELALIKKAVEITDKGFEKIKKEIKLGMTEKQVARRLEQIFEELGADGKSFDSIVASGAVSSLPHYMPQNKKIKKGILLIDAGAKFKGYNGDFTRTFYIGKPDKKFIERYNLVLEAQARALKEITTGKTEEEIWKVSMDALGDQSKYFIHGLGHGIGLDVHESPYLRKDKKMKLLNGMAITVEPGVYYPGWGGIRIEDYIVIERGRCKVLSKYTKSVSDMIIG